jgi:acyl carrier protein
MSEIARHFTNLPPEQEAIRAKCFHPAGMFVEFKKEEVEQSIPQRFEKIVRRYPERIAIKTQGDTLTYDELNKHSNRLARALLARRSTRNEPVAIFLEHGAPIIIASSYIAPKSPIEEELAKIWGDVLGIKQVGINDTFFDLGGHSLRATQLISRIIMTLKIELPIRFLLDSPTIAEMAAAITEHQGKELGAKEMESLLAELESLTAEEANHLLADNRISSTDKMR